MLSERSAGILLHPTSLPSSAGIGDFGPQAYGFADFLARARQTSWQVLPLSPPGLGSSPYSAISAFAGNPLLISLERLVEKGWLPSSVSLPHGAADGPVLFDRVIEAKMPLLRQAARNFTRRQGAQHAAFEKFKRENIDWLEDFVLFNVARNAHGGASWHTWPAELARREPHALHRFGLQYVHELEVERAIQFAFFEQWRALRGYCRARGIRVIGDVAIFVNYDSADVWRHSELFHLDHDLQPTVVAGVPPDAFSATGQRWGNPLYRWDLFRERGYDWWIRRMSWACRNFDMVRIDHFRGFESFWEIPAAEPNAIRGHWVKGPGDELFSALRTALGDLPVLAEDLGMITPEVHALRKRIGVPGMKVLQFGFSDPGAHIYLPHNFEPNCVVYTGTHDNDTTIGWWNSSATPDEKRCVRAYAGDAGDGINWTLVRMAYASVARLAVAPMQDVLGLGSESRMNIPSKESGNWSWRMAPDSLTSALAEKLAALVEIADRMPGSVAAEAGEESAYAA